MLAIMTAADRPSAAAGCSLDLYWIPLGAGDTTGAVKLTGRAFESLSARREHRAPVRLLHSALVVRRSADRFAIEMAPEWSGGRGDHGAVARGPVGARALGRSRWFRYEVRRWRDGVIPDLPAAVGSPVRVDSDPTRTTLLLDVMPSFPTATWGRDELGLGEMWNSNSLTSWLLARSGHEAVSITCPAGWRAPGWSAGLAAARRTDLSPAG